MTPDEAADEKKREVNRAAVLGPAGPKPEKRPSNYEEALKDRDMRRGYEAGEKARKENMGTPGFKKGGKVDGIAQRGKTRGKVI